jgi:hypothetical protein
MINEEPNSSLQSSGGSVISESSGSLGDGLELDELSGDGEMADDPRLEKAFALIREVIADERAKAIADVVQAVTSQTVVMGSGPLKPGALSGISSRAQRAPSGSARVLCERVLGEARQHGLTTLKIKDLATSEYEKMLSSSAIRNELATGEREKPPRYRQVGGVWYLSQFAPVLKEVS